MTEALSFILGRTDPELQWDVRRGGFYKLMPAKDKPCGRCPCLTANFDKIGEPPLEHAGTYLPESRHKLWTTGECNVSGPRREPGPPTGDGLRGGGGMICHIRRDDGGLPDGAATVAVHGCTSGLVLQQRELLRYVERGPTPDGLTPDGAATLASLMLGREITPARVRELEVQELLAVTHPALLDEGIGIEDLEPVTDRERRAWAKALTAGSGGIGR